MNGKAIYSRTKTPDGMATITVLVDPGVEDKAGTIRSRMGSSLIALDRLEGILLERLEELHDAMRQVDEMVGHL